MKAKNTLIALLAFTGLNTVNYAQENGKTPLMCSVSLTMPKCHGSSDGQIDLNITGGFPPYTVVWENGSGGSTLSGVSAGSYDVMVIDAHQDTISGPITMIEPNEIMVSGIVTDVSNMGQANGAIDVSVTGLLEPYTYSWGTVDGAGLDQTSLDQSGLKIGTYSLKVTSESGCIVQRDFRVDLSLMLNFQNVAFGGNTAPDQRIVYPNPSNGPVNFRNVANDDTIEIFNSFGNLVQKVNDQGAIQLPTGNYQVIIQKADGTVQIEPLIIR